MHIDSYSLQGKRDSNEDQHIGIININNNNKKINKINFVGVFDGHGGKAVSKYLKKNLPYYFLKKNKINIYGEKSAAVKYFFNGLFDKVQSNLKKSHPIVASRCGSTCLCGIQCR